MEGNLQLLIPIILPIIGGILILMLRNIESKKITKSIYIIFTFITGITSILNCFGGEKTLNIGTFASNFPIILRLDEIGIFFSVLTSIVWMIVAIYTLRYIEHEKNQNIFLGFYLLVYGILIGLDYSATLITMYIFYELMTMATLVLVVHARTKKAVSATLKYLMYSLFGAFLGLICIFYINSYGLGLEFTDGGIFQNFNSSKEILLVIAFLGIVGFGTKAGMFPLYDWLPDAHPVAPAPASAVLSGIITKSGVLALIRYIYYIFGAEFIRGEWVQFVWIALALITVLTGSVLAYKEKELKKRLAYSTVSQVSYVLFGLAILTQEAFMGAVMHVAFHSLIKVCLFLCAGMIIFKTGIKEVDKVSGIGKKMPVTIVCFTIASLGLVGIPPLNGFVSKWLLIEGSLDANLSIISYLGPAVLIISAILTAGYLFPITFKAFYEKKDETVIIDNPRKDGLMVIPVIILAVLISLTGVFATEIVEFIQNVTMNLF